MKGYAMLKIGESGWIEKDRPACGPMDAICKPLAVAICTSDVHTLWEGAIGDRHNMILGHLDGVIFLALFADQIMVLILGIAGTPYDWVVDTALPPIEFSNFGSVLTVIVGCLASGSVSLIVLILVIIIAWNYIKLLFEAAERYILVGVLIYTAPIAFATGASESTSNVFSAWCRMLGGQLFLLIMNAWCLRLFTSMVGNFLANPLSI